MRPNGTWERPGRCLGPWWAIRPRGFSAPLVFGFLGWPYFEFLAYAVFEHSPEKFVKQRKQKSILIFTNIAFYYRLGSTLWLFLDVLDVNVMKRYNIGFQEHLESMPVHHVPISHCTHDCNHSCRRE